MMSLKNKNGLFQHRNSPLFYPILFHFVPWHFGQGGRVSELSSNLITSPQFTHLYKPLPGFSPVVYIIEKIKRLITRPFNCHGLTQTKTVFGTLLRMLFRRTNFNCFSNSCSWAFNSLFCWNKFSRTSVSNSF